MKNRNNKNQKNITLCYAFLTGILELLCLIYLLKENYIVFSIILISAVFVFTKFLDKVLDYLKEHEDKYD